MVNVGGAGGGGGGGGSDVMVNIGGGGVGGYPKDRELVLGWKQPSEGLHYT